MLVSVAGGARPARACAPLSGVRVAEEATALTWRRGGSALGSAPLVCGRALARPNTALLEDAPPAAAFRVSDAARPPSMFFICALASIVD